MDSSAQSAAPATLREVSAWAGDANSRLNFSPLGTQPFLLFNAATAGIATRERERIDAWLRQLPCPIIGIAQSGTDNMPMDACDVVLDSDSTAGPLITVIRHSPIAAAVAVQLLRSTAKMPLLDALSMESLAYATLQSGPEYRRWLAENRAEHPAAAKDDGPPLLMQRDGEYLHIELNRASNHNAISVELRDALIEALQLVLADDSILSVKISGRGKCFSVGGDLSEFGSVPDPATGHIIRNLALPARLLAQCAERVDFELHSACIGAGIELPAFGRRIVAARDTFIQLPELRFGLIPGAGGCVSLPRRIGRQRAGWLILSGQRLGAAKALEWGLVDAISEQPAKPAT